MPPPGRGTAAIALVVASALLCPPVALASNRDTLNLSGNLTLNSGGEFSGTSLDIQVTLF